jgi:glycosyltransferase involved in cell wall biosynthesis
MDKSLTALASSLPTGTADKSAADLLANAKVALLTAGKDRHYVYGLAFALLSQGVQLDFIGGDALDSPELRACPNLNFLNILPDLPCQASVFRKILRLAAYYVQLIHYARRARPRIFHIFWNGKLELFDRTLLMLYYKALGKKIVLTAHNVNGARRNGNDSALNRATLRIQYHLVDHVFVHTKRMKRELIAEFGVRENAISIIPHGIVAVPVTALTPAMARKRLGIAEGEKTILCFGRIMPYKGVELLATAFQQLASRSGDYRLIIAGPLEKGADAYLRDIRERLSTVDSGRIVQDVRYIPDDEIEVYFKAADVVALPYLEIFQSGVLFAAYSFGVPVVAADVGLFKEDVVEGETGFICPPGDANELARILEANFESSLYKNLDRSREEIKDWVRKGHTWELVSQITNGVYRELLAMESGTESNERYSTEHRS